MLRELGERWFMRTWVVILALNFLLGLSADTPAQQLSLDVRANLAGICKHYVNRARFLDRGGDQALVVTLADGCQDAQASLTAAGNAEREAAAVFLTRLSNLRNTVIDMNMVRVFGTEYTPFSRIGYGNSARTETVRKVSDTGEYLIAYRMGLLQAYRAWLDTGPRMALVSRRGARP